MMTYESITREMIEALTAEIEAIKNDKNSQIVPLQTGIRRGIIAGRFLYSFILNQEISVLDDTPAQLIVKDQSYDAVVVTVEGYELIVALKKDIGERVQQASLNMSPYYLLELLKKHLVKTLSGELKVNKEMSLKLFNQQPNAKITSIPDISLLLTKQHCDNAPGDCVNKFL